MITIVSLLRVTILNDVADIIIDNFNADIREKVNDDREDVVRTIYGANRSTTFMLYELLDQP